jgi:hypothetical protein
MVCEAQAKLTQRNLRKQLRVSYKTSARTTQKTQLFYCYVPVCRGSHMIATHTVHWCAGCCLATVAARTPEENTAPIVVSV